MHFLLSFPWRDPERLAKWISRISRKGKDGELWYPLKTDKVCSAHFLRDDFYQGLDLRRLKDDAVPSVFPQYPAHKQPALTPRRPSPRKRKEPPTSTAASKPLKVFCGDDHNYGHSSIESHLQKTQVKLAKSIE